MKNISYLGTTFSCVAVWDETTYDARIIENSYGYRTTPSYVAFTDAEQLVGDAAVNQSIQNRTNTVYNIKRLIGRHFFDETVQQDIEHLPYKVININDHPMISVTFRKKHRSLTPEEISSRILRYLRQTAEQALKTSVSNCVITVPAYFNHRQRQATMDAAKIAGLKVAQIISEPIASALAFAMHNRLYHDKNKKSKDDHDDKKDPTNQVLVYDLGGGTLDISILAIDQGEFKVLATGGHTHLGGEDLTRSMLDHLVQAIQTDRGINVVANKIMYRRLRAGCERAKIGLSSATRYILDLEDFFGPDDGLHTVIQRDRFEEIIRPIVDQTFVILNDTLDQAGLRKSEVDDILLVGGSVRIPLVRQRITDFFGKAPNGSVNPNEAVATGAAIHAAVLSGAMDCQYYGSTNLHDVAPLSFGTDISGNVMDVLIDRNTPLPTQATKTYYNAQKFQTKMHIKVYQGERKLASENTLLGMVTLDPLFPAAQRGECGVDVTFILDRQGTLTVQARCPRSAQFCELLFKVGNLSRKKIKRMVNHAVEFETQDQRHVKKEKARQALEDYCAVVLGMPDDNDGAMVMANQAAEETLLWIDDHRAHATKEDYTMKKAQLKDQVETLLNEQELDENEDEAVYFGEELCFADE